MVSVRLIWNGVKFGVHVNIEKEVCLPKNPFLLVIGLLDIPTEDKVIVVCRYFGKHSSL